jgi:hypothetical protein
VFGVWLSVCLAVIILVRCYLDPMEAVRPEQAKTACVFDSTKMNKVREREEGIPFLIVSGPPHKFCLCIKKWILISDLIISKIPYYNELTFDLSTNKSSCLELWW